MLCGLHIDRQGLAKGSSDRVNRKSLPRACQILPESNVGSTGVSGTA